MDANKSVDTSRWVRGGVALFVAAIVYAVTFVAEANARGKK